MGNLFKKLALVLLTATFVISFIACGSDEPKVPEQTENTYYYIKYEIDMPSKWYNTVKDITYVSEKGEQSFSTTEKSWEGTYGPLKKGSKVYLKIKSNSPNEYSYVQSYNCARIYVSREKEPFVVKADDEGRKDLMLTYIIDF